MKITWADVVAAAFLFIGAFLGFFIKEAIIKQTILQFSGVIAGMLVMREK